MRLKTTAQSLLSELQYFPGRRHLLVETNQIHADALAEVCGAHPHWTYCMRAVGPKNATLFFDGSDPLGGHGSEVSHTPDYKPFPVSPLDRLLEENPLPPPFLVKLNVHGIEIQILNNAVETLKQTNVLVIEAYNFKFPDAAVPFWDLCQHLLTLGYKPADSDVPPRFFQGSRPYRESRHSACIFRTFLDD